MQCCMNEPITKEVFFFFKRKVEKEKMINELTKKVFKSFTNLPTSTN